MKKPTKKQVREYFKDAKIVRCQANGQLYDITEWDEIRNYEGTEMLCGKKGFDDGYADSFVSLWDYCKGYAEIVEYKDGSKKGGINHTGNEDIIMPNFKLTTDRNIKYLEDMKQNTTEYTLSFETVGAVHVILKGKNLDNLNAVAESIGE